MRQRLQIFFQYTDKNLPYFRSIWTWTCITYYAKIILIKFKVDQRIRSWLITFLLLLRYVTLCHWPSTLWHWTFVMYWLSRDQAPFRILWKSRNPRRSYCDFNMSNWARSAIFNLTGSWLSQPLGSHNAFKYQIPAKSDNRGWIVNELTNFQARFQGANF